jgi:hypothetical protein
MEIVKIINSNKCNNSYGNSPLDSMQPLGIKVCNKNHRIEIPYVSSFNKWNREEITIEVEVHIDQQSSGYFVVQRRRFALGINQDGYIRFSLGNSYPGWVWKTTAIKIPYLQWVHIALIFSSIEETVTISLDGGKMTEKFTSKGPLESSDHPLYFGLSLENEKNWMNCSIKNIKIWGKALSQNEILSSIKYMTNVSTIESVDPSLKNYLTGWWPINERKGTKIYDISGHEYHGDLVGAQWVIVFNKSVTQFKQNLKSMFNNPIGSDIILKVNDSENNENKNFLYAHKIILTQRSPVFHSMLLGGMKESSQKEIFLKDISFKTLSQLIEFLYTDEIQLDETWNYNDVIELFQSADKYGVSFLKNLCEEHLIKSINLENVCQILDCSDRMNSLIVKSTCKQFMMNHFGDILKSGFFFFK